MEQVRIMKKPQLDISAIWNELWQKKLIIILVTVVFAVGSIAYALSLPNKYGSKAVLASAKSNKGSSLSSLAGQFGGLAGLAGINLGSGSTLFIIMEQIQSKDFINHFVEKHDLLIPLFAATGYDPKTGELTYENQKEYDFATKQWIRDVKLPAKPKPSSDEIYEAFKDGFSVDMDRKTKIVTISWSFLSPKTAHQWLDWYIQDFNDYVREIDLTKTNDNMAYLQQQVDKTSIAQIQDVLYNLIEEQIKTKMLSEVQAEYALMTIDSASVPSEKKGPRRAIMVIAGTFAGGFLSCIFVLLLFFRRMEQQ